MKELFPSTIGLIIKAYCKAQKIRLTTEQLNNIVDKCHPKMTQAELLDVIHEETGWKKDEK